jgi:RHS repeat-associated protein
MMEYTAHVHMNGRVYDPNLGRFLSVDPVFQFPTNTQSLNPYSYVLNNPLSQTDPTGYTCQSTESVSDCAGTLKNGQKTDIVNGKGQNVGTVGKDKDGNLLVTKGNGSNFNQPAQFVTNFKAISDHTSIGSPATRMSGPTSTTTKSSSSAPDANGYTPREPKDISNKVDPNPYLVGYITTTSSTDGKIMAMSMRIPYAGVGVSNKQMRDFKTQVEAMLNGKSFTSAGLATYLITVSLYRVAASNAAAHLTLYACDSRCTGGEPQGYVGFPAIYLPGRVTDPYTYTHEFLHTLGLHHQANETGSIMSYALHRKIRYQDIKRLVDRYVNY